MADEQRNGNPVEENSDSHHENSSEIHLVNPEDIIIVQVDLDEDSMGRVAGEIIQYDGKLTVDENGTVDLRAPTEGAEGECSVSSVEQEISPGNKYEWCQGDEYNPIYSVDSELGLHALGRKYHKRLGHIRCVLIDLSGTIHVGGYLIPGALEGIYLLRKFNIPYRFVTNTTKEPKRVLVERLQEFGFPVQPEDIITSMTATKEFLQRNGLRPLFILEDEALEDFEGISQVNLNSVCVGLSPTKLDYVHIEQATKIIQQGAPLIGIHAGQYQRDLDGELSLGPGPFLKMLEGICHVNALIVGKPTRRIFESAVKSMNFELEDAVMVGDDIEDDVAGAMQHGMHGILVQTGKFAEGDERRSQFPPNMIALDFRTAARAIVGAVCMERQISTGETDDEDEKGLLKRKSYPFSDCPPLQNL